MSPDAVSGVRISPAALVAGRGRRVVVVGRTARLDLRLDVAASPPGELSTATELAHRWGASDAEPLRAALEAAGALDVTGPDTATPPEVLPLTGMAEYSGDLTRRLVVTAAEALWTGSDPQLARTALTLFVGRLPDRARRQVHLAQAGPNRPWCVGDVPEATALAQVPAAARQSSHPSVFELAGGRCTGELRGPGAALDPAAGRLAVGGPLVEDVIEDVIEGGRGHLLHLASAVAASPTVLGDRFAEPAGESVWVAGADFDASVARTRCLAEAAEYVTSSTALSGHGVDAPADALDGPWLSPEAVIRYTAAHRRRLGVQPFDPAEPHQWLPARRAGLPVWAPACLLTDQVAPRPSWWHPSSVSSSGVAAHPDPLRAEAAAWLELVERDAVQRSRALAWAAPPPRLDPASLPPTERALHDMLQARATSVDVLLLPSPTGLPVVLVRADEVEGTVNLGAAAARHCTVAVRRALVEALTMIGRTAPRVIAVEEVRTPGDHVDLYRSAAWRDRLDWMRHGPTVPMGAVPSGTGITPPPTAVVWRYPTLGLPVTVVRVLDPALIPLTFGFDSDADGRPDLAALWRRSGRSTDRPLDPHPLG